MIPGPYRPNKWRATSFFSFTLSVDHIFALRSSRSLGCCFQLLLLLLLWFLSIQKVFLWHQRNRQKKVSTLCLTAQRNDKFGLVPRVSLFPKSKSGKQRDFRKNKTRRYSTEGWRQIKKQTLTNHNYNLPHFKCICICIARQHQN